MTDDPVDPRTPDGIDPMKSDAEVEADAAGADAGADAVAAEAEAAAEAAVDRQALLDNDEVDGPTANDYSIAFSPRNVAVGLAIVAGLVALAARRRRRRGGSDGEDG